MIMNPQTTFAQVNTINYNNASLENRDFPILILSVELL